MIARVLDALSGSDAVEEVIIVGLPPAAAVQLEETLLMRSEKTRMMAGSDSPAASVSAVLQHLESDRPVLVTTADHPLLRADIVDDFLAAAEHSGADAVIGLVPYRYVREAAPDTRRTVTRLRDDQFCGCNLFALLTPQSRHAVDFWRQLEQHRKRPLMIARFLGLGTLLRFVLGRLSLDQAMARLSTKIGARVGAVLLRHGEAGIDVDKPDDLRVVEALLSEERRSAGI